MTKAHAEFLQELKKTLKAINKTTKKIPGRSIDESHIMEGQTNMAKFVISLIEKFEAEINNENCK